MRLSKTFLRFATAYASGKYRTFVLQGGTSSTKTYSVLQFLYLKARASMVPLTISVVSESLPHLKRGALRDFISILGVDYNEGMHNKTDNSFLIGLSTVEFFAIDQPDKAKGGRRDILYINECNRIQKELRDQLVMRTRGAEILDFNPDSRFWAHELKGRDGVWFDVSTYKDAIDCQGSLLLSNDIIKTIESYKDTNPNWWKVYGLGEIGQLEGLIIPEFNIVKEMPDIETDCGLDFGFTHDPSCLVECGFMDGELYINELFYERGLTNQDIVRKFEELSIPKTHYIVADSAEPKSIEEIYRAGYNIVPCVKGEDSFKYGVDKIKAFKINVTENSVNVIKDFRNASWDKDKDGNHINKARKGFLHSIDATRYALNKLILTPAETRTGWVKGL